MSTENKNKAIARLIELLKQEAFLLPPVPDEQDLEEVVVEANNNQGGLEAAFEELRNRAKKDEPEGHEETEEMVVESFLKSKLEKQNLACWAKFEENSKGSNIKLALCRLARKYLTPPPTSTNTERLFSVAGQVMDEKRARILPDSLDKILFLRENMLACNFNLDW
jgi:hypothetical protein